MKNFRKQKKKSMYDECKNYFEKVILFIYLIYLMAREKKSLFPRYRYIYSHTKLNM